MDSEIDQGDSMQFSCSNCLDDLTIFEEEGTPAPVQATNNYLTECYHVLCQNCHTQGKNRCLACGKTTKCMVISRSMPEKYQLLFEPLSKLQSYIDDVSEFDCEQDEVIHSLMNDKCKQQERKVKQHVSAAKQELDETKAKAHKMKLIFERVVTELRRREEMKRKPWMEFEETEFVVKNEPSDCQYSNKSWTETEQSSTRVRNELPERHRSSKDRRRFGQVLSQAPNGPARRTSMDRRQQSRPLTQAHVEAAKCSSKDRRPIDHSSSTVRDEFPERRRNNVNIETSTDYGEVLAHQNRLPELKTPESFDMTFGSGNSLQTRK